MAPRPRSGLVSPLAGRISDSEGNKLISAHANQHGRRYRYYVSSTHDSKDGWRLPAGDLESMVQRAIENLLRDPQRIAGLLGQAPRSPIAASPRLLAKSSASGSNQLRQWLEGLDSKVIIDRHWVQIELDSVRLAETTGVTLPTGIPVEPIQLTIPAVLRRRGHELRLVYAAPDASPANTDPTLINLIARGWAAWDQLSKGPRPSDPVKRSHLARLARLRFLAPDITVAILEGRQPVELTARSRLRISELPTLWQNQRRALGFV